MSLHEFFSMGGYAAYVWPAYAVFFVVLIADYLAPIVRRRGVLRELRGRMTRQNARASRNSRVSRTPEEFRVCAPESQVPRPESRQ